MSNQPPKNPTVPASARPAPGTAPAPARGVRIDDDVLHVPKGVSRGTFLFLIALLIFLLVIWLVPGPMLGIAGGSGNPVAARLELPRGGTVEWKANDLLVQKRVLVDALAFDKLLGFQLGLDPDKPDPDELLRILLLDRVAADAGVEVTDADLREHLNGVLQFSRATPEDFRGSLARRGLSVRAIEETLRRLMRVLRFQQLVAFAGAVPDPAVIEELWHADNVEFAFDYAVLEAATLTEEARQSLPDEAGLEAWFTALQEAEKDPYRTPEKRTAELALFRDTETTPAAELLTAYPEPVPEGAAPTAPEELATRYYNRVYFQRFRKPPEDGADPSVPPGFFTQEEVQEQCLAEAGVYFALQRWIEDLNARRTNGETIDLAAEAARLGLDHHAYLEPLSQEEYVADTALGDKELSNAIFENPADGSFWASPVALRQGLCVVRTHSLVEPALPPFAEIRERVAEAWLGPKADELARERLAKLREGFERFEPPPAEDGDAPATRPPGATHYRATAEAFRSAVEGAGLTVMHRDYLNKAGPATQDPVADDEDHRTLLSQARTFGLYELEPDEVAEPGSDRGGKKAYLVRLAGKREVPIDDMSPLQYKRYKDTARARALADVGEQLDLDFLRRNYGLWLYEDSDEAKAARAEAEKAQAERAAKDE